MSRLLSALVAVPLLLALILVAPASWFAWTVLLAGVVGFWELTSLARKLGWTPHPLLGTLAITSYVAGFYFWNVGFGTLTLFWIPAVGAFVALTATPSERGLASIGFAGFGIVYLGGLAVSLTALRVSGTDPEGRYWIIFLLAVVMTGDAGAYYSGRALGRHPLAPRVSPKKTVEGLLGGLLVSMATAWGLGAFLLPSLGLAESLGLGLALSAAGVLGDLFESLLKRSAGVKDASQLIPGHGGLLDRMDSLAFAAPLLYLYLQIS